MNNIPSGLTFVFFWVAYLVFFLTNSLTVVIIAHFFGDMIGLTIQAIGISKKKKTKF